MVAAGVSRACSPRNVHRRYSDRGWIRFRFVSAQRLTPPKYCPSTSKGVKKYQKENTFREDEDDHGAKTPAKSKKRKGSDVTSDASGWEDVGF